MSKFKMRFGICLFSALVLAIGVSPIASAYSVEVKEQGNIVLVSMVGDVADQDVVVMTGANGTQFGMRVAEISGTGSPLAFRQTWMKLNNGSSSTNALLNKRWNVAVQLPAIASYISRSKLLTYYEKTNALYISVTVEYFNSEDSIISLDSTVTSGGSFALVQSLGDLTRYTWKIDIDNDSFESFINSLYDSGFTFQMPFRGTRNVFVSEMASQDFFVSAFNISNNLEGAVLPDADSTTVIVDGLDNLGDAIDDSITAGVEEIESVVLQQTDEITGAVESQTEALLNYRSDVDMSVSENAEVATKLAQEAVLNQQVYDQYSELEYDRDLSGVIDTDFGEGVGFLSSAMQRILNFGVDNLVVVLLTIGTSLFIIGRSMR